MLNNRSNIKKVTIEEAYIYFFLFHTVICSPKWGSALETVNLNICEDTGSWNQPAQSLAALKFLQMFLSVK